MQLVLQKETLHQCTGFDTTDDSGLLHGQGKAEYASGQVYDGTWQHGHMHGLGTIKFPDQITFKGTFQTDNITGSGEYTWPDAVYQGDVLNGLRHGQGRLSVVGSPVTYEGQWQHGKRHGRGTLFYNEDKTAFYDGAWQDDMKHGSGASVYPSGNSYSGRWHHDQRHGQGTMHWSNTGQRYTGQWSQGLQHGAGEHVWEQQRVQQSLLGANHAMNVRHNRYVGMFHQGQRHGQGTLYYSSGARYEGEWQHGRKHGQGVFVFEDGSVFIGHFVEDRPVMSSGALLGAASTLPAAAAAAVNITSSRTRGSSINSCQQTQSLSSSAGSTPRRAAAQLPPAARAASASDGVTCSSIIAAPDTVCVANAAGVQPPTDYAAEPAAPASCEPASKAAGGLQMPAAKGRARGVSSSSGAAQKKPATGKAATPAAAATSKHDPAAASSSPAPTAVEAAPSKRASTAASSMAPDKQSLPLGVFDSKVTASAVASSCGAPGFGPSVSVVQLYISDLLQQYDGDAAAVHRAVTNMLVGCNTELRSLYDLYSAVPSALRDTSALTTSWALQTCQLWELLRDARLLGRTVSLHRVCALTCRATAPPPAVQQHRQQVLQAAGSAGGEGTWRDTQDSPGLYAPGTQLLFRDFCELLVRLAAARYPLLPSLELQLQQVLSLHLLPLLNTAGASRPAGMAPRASAISAAAGAGPAGGVDACGEASGCEQLLRSPEVVAYLEGRVHLLQQLYVAMSGGAAEAAVVEAMGPAAETGGSTAAEAEPAAATCERSGQLEAAGQEAAGDVVWQQRCVPVRRLLQALQDEGVLERWALTPDAMAACLLHSMLGVTDPQGARACIDVSPEGTVTPDAAQPGDSSDGAAGLPGPQASAAALQQELLFWLDAPLLLQDVLWGLTRLAVVIASLDQEHLGPNTTGTVPHATPQGPHTLQQQQQQSPGAVGSQQAASAAGDALEAYIRCFLQGCIGSCSAVSLLHTLTALLEGPSGLLKPGLPAGAEPPVVPGYGSGQQGRDGASSCQGAVTAGGPAGDQQQGLAAAMQEAVEATGDEEEQQQQQSLEAAEDEDVDGGDPAADETA